MDDRHEESHELDDSFPNAHATLLNDLQRQEECSPAINPLPRTTERSTAFLDGLRGLAALFVFVQHYIGSFDANVHEHGFGEHGNFYLTSLPFLRLFFSGGNAAVAIFFVLSGYVLSKSPLSLLRDEQHRACAVSLASAVVRRPIRLYVPTVGVALVTAMLMHAPFDIMPAQPWPQPQESIIAEFGTLLLESVKFFNPFQLHGSNHAWFPYNIVAWTIPIELKGSMLVYGLIAIYAFSGVPRSLSLLLLIFAGVALLQLGQWTVACFIFGLILAYVDVHSLDTTYLARHLTHRARFVLKHVIFFAGYYLLCQPAHAGHPEYSLGTPGWHYLTRLTPRVYDKALYYKYWLSWGGILMVYSALRILWLQRFLNTRPLRYLGKVSFMLYLVHLTVLNILGSRIARIFGQINPDAKESLWNDWLHLPDIGSAGLNSRFLASALVMLLICLAVADVGTRVLDTPCVRLGKRLAQKLGLDSGSSGRKAAENEEARLPEHSVHLQVLRQ